MKHLISLTVLSVMAISNVQAESFVDQARVRSVDPIYETVNIPHKECNNKIIVERVQRNDPPVNNDRQYGGAIVGGLLGGAIGHQIGKGSGKDAATALGVVIGAMAGDKAQNQDTVNRPDNRNNRHNEYDVEREVVNCHTINDIEKRISGYRVNYEYQGQSYTTRIQNDPGRSLQVRVSIEPIDR